MFVLQKRVLGPQPRIEIVAERYEALKKAHEVQRGALDFEEKLDLFIANYEELEGDLLTITLSHMIRRNPTWDGMHSSRLLLTRRISNLLSSGRLYINQIRHLASFSVLGFTTTHVGDHLSAQFDRWLGYRVMEGLRNHMQHRTLAITGISYPGIIERRDGNPLWRSGIALTLDIEALRADDSLRKATLSELESLNERQNDLILFVRQYVESIGLVHGSLRSLSQASVTEADAVMNDALKEWEATGNDTLGLAARKLREDGVREDEYCSVMSELRDRRNALVSANSSFVNLPRRYTSGERPPDAYPPFQSA